MIGLSNPAFGNECTIKN
ncbi:hypothetical protein [Streptomyces coeruleorubidus]